MTLLTAKEGRELLNCETDYAFRKIIHNEQITRHKADNPGRKRMYKYALSDLQALTDKTYTKKTPGVAKGYKAGPKHITYQGCIDAGMTGDEAMHYCQDNIHKLGSY